MILDSIVQNTRKEVEERKKNLPLEGKIEKSKKDFKKAIGGSGVNIIAEIKHKSPSTGILREDFNVQTITTLYDKSKSVKAVSVVTNNKFFGMRPESLREVAQYTEKPLLRKEFIIDEYQIRESRWYGADAILLIASVLPKAKLALFIKKAKELGMDSLVEVHTKKELDQALQTNAEIIGINNRNLDTLKINLETCNKLAKHIPSHVLIVAESGYTTHEEIRNADADAFLIGTALLKAKDIQQKLNELCHD